MKQVNNGFSADYYMTKEGQIYDKSKDKYIKPNKKHLFTLRTETNERKIISLRTLYKLVYNERYCKDNIQNLDNEVWKEIDNTDKKYYVSNKGRVKSMQGYEAIILKPFKNKTGYERIDIIQQDEVRTTKLIHRLVAAAFLPIPKNIDMQIHHIDFNNCNNAADNLQWLNPAEHRKKHKEKEIKKNEQISKSKKYNCK